MNDLAIEIIQKYISDFENRKHYWSKPMFKQNSYAKWSAEELLERVQNRKNVPAIYVIEDFIRLMDRYACMNPHNSYMFSVAHDTAEDILDFILVAH